MEQNISYLIFGLVCFLVAVHYFTKILDWNTRRLKSKFKDNKTEFTSDLYNLQKKWNNKGEFDFSQAINTVILHFNIPEEPKASTQYGKEIQKKLKELEEDES